MDGHFNHRANLAVRNEHMTELNAVAAPVVLDLSVLISHSRGQCRNILDISTGSCSLKALGNISHFSRFYKG